MVRRLHLECVSEGGRGSAGAGAEARLQYRAFSCGIDIPTPQESCSRWKAMICPCLETRYMDSNRGVIAIVEDVTGVERYQATQRIFWD